MSFWCLSSSFSSIQHSLGGDVVGRFSRWPTWGPSWIAEWNDFSNSKWPCGPNASHQVWAQYHRVWEQMWFQDFKDTAKAAILDSQTERFKQFWISMSLQCFPSSFGSISSGDVIWRISRLPPWWPSWISERNIFINSEPQCSSDVSHQVLAQSDTVCEVMSFEEFQDGGHLGYQNWKTLANLNLYNASIPPIKLQVNLTYGLGGDVFWRISRLPPWNDFSNSEFISVSLWCLHSSFGSIQLTVREEGILDIRTEWF